MASDIIKAITSIFDLLKFGSDVKRKKKEAEREALLALHKAVNETRIFFHEIDDYELEGIDNEENR